MLLLVNPEPSVSKSDQAYTVLRARILDGTYGPGYRLVVDALGRELGMSPIPLREAVRRLEAEGWVVIRRYAGATVAPADPRSLVANMEALTLLEGPAMRLLAEVGVSTAELAEPARINGEMRDAVARLSVLDTNRLNREFHSALYALVPNAPLVGYLHQTWAELSRMRRSTLFYLPRAPHSVEEHDELLAMLRGGADPEVVSRFAHDHRIRTLEALFANNPDVSGEHSVLLHGPQAAVDHRTDGTSARRA